MTPVAERRARLRRVILAWGPVGLYMAVIFLASAQPEMPLQGKTSLSDKSIHALAYAGLTLVAYRAALIVPLSRGHAPLTSAFLVAVLYGVLDEVHQALVPGREADIRDWLADVAGALTAVLAIALIRILSNRGGTRSVRRREGL